VIATNPSANLKSTKQSAVTGYAKFCMPIKGKICNNNKQALPYVFAYFAYAGHTNFSNCLKYASMIYVIQHYE
jgi:hypothetical protein